MNEGSVLQVGSPEDIYHRPSTRFVAEFLGHCNVLAARALTTASSGTAEVRLDANGTTITVATEDLATGQEVQLAVRPEAVEVAGPGSAAGENTYAGELRTASFLGDHYLYELDVGGLTLTATSARSVAGPAVTVRIPPSACRVLPS
jgi:ABC-type Fe3+/spermidine/putrescine transport system ATPase subunit